MLPIVILPLALLQGSAAGKVENGPAAPPAPPVIIRTVPPPPAPSPPVINTVLVPSPVPSPPPAPRSPLDYKPPSPRGNPGTWANSNDYPTRALRDELEGVTRFRVTVGPNGLVTECVVTGSSGSPELDMTSCALIVRRGRFNPAMVGGKPTVGTWSSSIRWSIPDFGPPLLASRTVLRMVVEIDGSASQCTVEIIAAGAEPYPQPCNGVRFAVPYRAEDGSLIRRAAVVTTETSVADAPPARAPTGAAGSRAIQVEQSTVAPFPGTIVKVFDVNTEGVVTACRIESVTGLARHQYRVGPIVCPISRYDRYDEPQTGRKPKRVTVVETIAVASLP